VSVLRRWDAEQVRQLREAGNFVWLDLQDAPDQDVREAGQLFGLHPLAIEDALHREQRPKLDEYEDHVFLVVFGMKRSGIPYEVHVAVHGDWMLSVRRGPMSSLDALVERLGPVCTLGESSLVHGLVDTLVDSFTPALERLEGQLDELQVSALRGPSGADPSGILELHRTIADMRRVAGPQRDLIARATNALHALPGLEGAEEAYFRDVHDHATRVAEEVEEHRELLASVVTLHMSAVANRQNEVMKQLTLMSAVFLPLTFITGFFGQNFGWMVDNVDTRTDFVVWGLGGVLAAVICTVMWFRRRTLL